MSRRSSHSSRSPRTWGPLMPVLDVTDERTPALRQMCAGGALAAANLRRQLVVDTSGAASLRVDAALQPHQRYTRRTYLELVGRRRHRLPQPTSDS
jgi:hypothetical protein